MATTTPNFGWSVPTSTDLVKDGATAIETLGDAIDASLVDLKGGTTGQVLAKASNADMDFVWSADAAGMTNPMTTTGDTIYSSSGSTPARLGIGTAGQVLKVNSGATAPEWGTVASGSTWTLLNTGGTALTGAATITISGISNKENIMVIVDQSSATSAGSTIGIRINGDTATNYKLWGVALEGASTYSANIIKWIDDVGVNFYRIGKMSASASSLVTGGVMISGGLNTGIKAISAQGVGSAASSTTNVAYVTNGVYQGSAAISSISVFSDNSNFDAGTVYVYGA